MGTWRKRPSYVNESGSQKWEPGEIAPHMSMKRQGADD